MARRKARAARAAAKKNKENSTSNDAAATTDTTTADIVLGDAPALLPSTSTDGGAPPGGQAQAKQNENGNRANNNNNNKKRKETANTKPEPPPLETTSVDGVTYKIQPEGLANILLPDVEKTTEVFYNHIQQFNRDLTMAVTRAYGEMLDAERKIMKRKHRGGVKHKRPRKKRRSNDLDNPVVTAEEAEAGDEDEDVVDFEIEDQDVGMADASDEPKPRFAVLDALSATGLRALRYAKEVPFVTHVTANDMSPSAIESITRNIKFNGVEDIVKLSHDNAIGHMYRTAFPAYQADPTPENPSRMKQCKAEKYNVIDLDPYGSAAPFIDSALQAIEDGGLLSVTCTDAAIFASTSYPEKTFATYGGLPSKGDYSHEAGLRLVLLSIATTAGKYGLYIEPLLSLSIDYYCRVFVRVKKSPESVKKLASKSMIVVACDAGCGSWKVQEMGTLRERPGGPKLENGCIPSYKYGIGQAVESGRCDMCGFKMHVAGPMWSDPIHNAEFINRILSNGLMGDLGKRYGTLGRMTGTLKLAYGEVMPPVTPMSTPPPPAPPTAAPTVQSTEEKTGENSRPTLKRKFQQREAAADANLLTTTAIHGKDDLAPTKQQRNPTSDQLALFFMPTQVSRVLHCEAPSVPAIRGALLGLGYHVTKSHCRGGSIKTNAPWSVVWRVMRAWLKVKPIKEGTLKEGMAGYHLLLRAADDNDLEDVVFDEGLGREREKAKGEVMYQINPNAYWGPMAKANKKGLTAEESSKQGNAEKDKRRREEKERREKEAAGKRAGEEWAKRKKKRGQWRMGGEDEEGGEWEEVPLSPLPPAGPEESPVRTKESDGAQYGLAGISASDMERLEEQEKMLR
ncbi:RNA methyltransferase tRNA(m5U54)methyltransferase [Orbilia ellipsospora]|uniref:tRNA (guanine(26)-N(2))-dimethyltransferase n=1 Tax=Orbilia ellipsospora TaxID=2528407 RepID=A0AAV9XQ98_9PEZI